MEKISRSAFLFSKNFKKAGFDPGDFSPVTGLRKPLLLPLGRN